MMVYSGSYQMDVERSQTGLVRVVSGIQEERFAWNLKPGETFDTPEVILSFAAEGLTPLSQQYHRFLRRNICRGPWKDKRRPVLINNWKQPTLILIRKDPEHRKRRIRTWRGDAGA